MNRPGEKKQNEPLENAATTYSYTGCERAKETAVQKGEALVCYYANLYSPGRMEEDLKQAGYEGLLKALKRFEPAKEVKFSTYASHCIIGEIRHELRNRGTFKVPEGLRMLQARVLKVTEELAQKNESMPTLSEIAKVVNVSEEGIVEAMQAGCVSLDEIDLSKVRHLRYESFKLPIEDKLAMQISLEKMDKMQKKVIKMIFFEGLTQEQTAKRLGINQRKVSRLMHKGLKEMRTHVV